MLPTLRNFKVVLVVASLVIGKGLLSAQACYESAIVTPAPFLGNDGEIVKLADGSIWEVKYEYEYMYEYYPEVIICPSKGKLIVNGKSLNVELLAAGEPASSSHSRSASRSELIETRIAGEFSGWDGETIFKLENGQIWQQDTYSYLYSYKYRPKVIIVQTGRGHEMQVEGIARRVSVVRLK